MDERSTQKRVIDPLAPYVQTAAWDDHSKCALGWSCEALARFRAYFLHRRESAQLTEQEMTPVPVRQEPSLPRRAPSRKPQRGRNYAARTRVRTRIPCCSWICIVSSPCGRQPIVSCRGVS